MATMQESPALRRIVSIDALRGFDMFWIMGASSLVHGIQELAKSDKLQGIDPQRLELIADQLTHVAWEGFHFWDLIFPLFVFLMGTSAVFSLTKVITQRGKVAAYRRVLFRSLALYVLGLIYYGGRGDPESFRYVGVLQRIAICYLFGGLLFIHFRFRGLLAISAVLLGGYWAAMTFIDVPEHGRGNFQEGMNLANYIDKHYLPGYKWDGDWDPEGLLSTLPAIATGLLGMLAGLIIQNENSAAWKKLFYLLVLGGVCLAGGHFWGMHFPIIKKLWTSSYVLLAGGWSFLLLAVFYLVIDVWKIRFWAQPFVWIGTNCITIYMLQNFVGGFSSLVYRASPAWTIAQRVIPAQVVDQIEPYGPLTVSVLGLLFAMLLCRSLYRQGAFLRV